METVMTLAEVTIVTLVSVTLAFGLVWAGLLAAFHLLPTSPRPLRAATRPAREAVGLRWATVHAKAWPRVFKAGLNR
jgi:hypothetical protein